MEAVSSLGAAAAIGGAVGAAASIAQTAMSQLSDLAKRSSGKFTVTPENVLAAGKIVSSQAQALQKTLEASRRDLRIVPPGGDDVSTRIAPAWNDRLVYDDDSYAQRVADYVKGLDKLADQLEKAAQDYGYTEDQITAAFRGQSA